MYVAGSAKLSIGNLVAKTQPIHGRTAKYRVPSATNFARLSISDQSLRIHKVQSEIDALTDGVRTGRILPNHRGRGRALRDLRERQKRLDKLAGLFGFRREWRKHLRIPAASRRHPEGPAG